MLPLAFEANRGQTDPQVKFLSRRGGYTLFLTANEAVVCLKQSLRQSNGITSPLGGSPGTEEKSTILKMTWLGANPKARPYGMDEFSSRTNYLVGRNPQEWRTDVPSFAKVQYDNLYPGVDLLYYSTHGQLEYDLILSPGASADAIRLGLGAANKVHFDRNGDLLLKAGRQEMRLHKPVVYQPVSAGNPGDRDFVKGRYVLKGRGQIGFEIGAHDSSRPLIIDPQLTYSSYLGGSANDKGEKIAVDSSGNAYIVGHSASTDFPTVAPLQSSNAGSINVVISKLNPGAPGAASLIFSTYLGGSGSNVGRGIAVDAMGQIYITGDTNAPNFPVTTGAYQTACQLQAGVCSTDLFAAKLSANGSSLLYSSYIGGTGTELGFALAINAAGHMFIAGVTGSTDFPVSPGAFRTFFSGGGTPFGDAVVVELNPAGLGARDLIYATYLGGSGSEQAWGIAVDQTGAVYVTGSTTSSDFPVTPTAYQTTYSGSGNLNLGDAFVTELRLAGRGASDLVYSTYLGGANDDRGEGIAVDRANLVYVTGFTQSSGFPLTAATAYQTVFGGGTCGTGPCADAFLAKLNPGASGSASLLYSTLLGGNSYDLGHSVALDNAGFVYVTGETASTNFPVVNPIQSQCANNCDPFPMTDLFITKFDLSKTGTAALLFSTYLGGNDVDSAWSIGVDSQGNAYVTGQVFSTNFPTLIPFQAVCKSCSPFTSPTPSGESFLVKVCITNCPTASVSSNALAFASQTIGSSSPAQSITLFNSGSGDLTFAGVVITGAHSADFFQTNNCPVVVASQSSCTISVTFTPPTLGTRTATLTISDNFGTGAQSVNLSGTGIRPSVSLSATSLSFGNQTLNTASATQAVTLTNNGPGALTITSIAITGTNAGDYAQTRSCPIIPATLAANATCSINVTFTPTAAGPRTAAVTITDNAGDSPQPVNLSGAGVRPSVSLSATSLSFGNQTVNTTSTAQVVTLTNTGAGALAITSIAITGTNAGDYAQTRSCPISPATLAANATCSINVTFTPTAAGPRAAAVTITDNASDSPQPVNLSGAGVISPGAAGPPFGFIDTPANGATLAGEINVTGWALSSIGMTNCPAGPNGASLQQPGLRCVQIYREPLPGERTQSNGLVYVEDAVFVAGTRPDVAPICPTCPNNNSAGWGCQLLSNDLPGTDGKPIGNGSYKIHVIATDPSGLSTDLGTIAISVNNAASNVPFGAVDTPSQGQTVSGTILNFGWVLTPQPNFIAFDGSTINVFISGPCGGSPFTCGPVVISGHPTYNQARSDIQTLFPGYKNTNGAIGYFVIDTTKLSNAMYRIDWLATDSAGRTGGIASHYFFVRN